MVEIETQQGISSNLVRSKIIERMGQNYYKWSWLSSSVRN